MKILWQRMGLMMGMAVLAGVAIGCGGGVGESSDEPGVSSEVGARSELGEPGELGAACQGDGDCLSGICDDVSGAGAICLQDIQGDVVVTCLQDDGTLVCPEDPWSEVRFTRRIEGTLQVGYVTEPIDVVLPNLQEVSGNVIIGESIISSDVKLDGLVSVGGRLEIGFSEATGVSLASLEHVGASLRLAVMSNATTISMPSLQSVGSGGDDALSFWVLSSLAELDVPSLTLVDGNLTVAETPVLSEDSLAALDGVEVTGTRDILP